MATLSRGICQRLTSGGKAEADVAYDSLAKPKIARIESRSESDCKLLRQFQTVELERFCRRQLNLHEATYKVSCVLLISA